jgi:hypothetical protein
MAGPLKKWQLSSHLASEMPKEGSSIVLQVGILVYLLVFDLIGFVFAEEMEAG